MRFRRAGRKRIFAKKFNSGIGSPKVGRIIPIHRNGWEPLNSALKDNAPYLSRINVMGNREWTRMDAISKRPKKPGVNLRVFYSRPFASMRGSN
jgi:hypothetical protein